MTVEKIPIGKFAEITRLSKKALYCYEKKGLLIPVQKDICTGYRYYTSLQIEKGVWIKSLSALGFSLDEIETITGFNDKKCPEIREIIEKRLQITNEEIKRLKMAERILSSKNPFGELFKMELINWNIKEIPALRVISTQGSGPYGDVVSRLIERLCTEISSESNSGGQVKVSGPVMSIYIGEDCDDTGGLVEIALPVTGQVTVSDPEVSLKSLPPIKAVTVIHKGPYSNLGMAHKQIYDYINEKGLTMCGPSRELYLSDPADIPEEELLTEIQYPVED
ncbi:MAG: MerR family transcriptional regulator [Methanomicrobiaceae archaeon]|nr:MerR family transcriptional regulator [Methanomicrobiaceae archaeon]